MGWVDNTSIEKELEFQVHHFDTLDSTNQWLKQAVLYDHVGAGSVAHANYQSNGKGRLGRNWKAEPEQGLLFSMLLDPSLPDSHLPLIGLLVSLGIVDGLHELFPNDESIQLRWPNDILIDRRKLCGILCETAQTRTGARLVIAGIGLNVNQSAEDFPSDLRTPGVSLFMHTGIRHSPAKILPGLLGATGKLLDRLKHDGWGWVSKEWCERSDIIGKEVEVADGAGRIRGTVIDMLDDGALALRTPDGQSRIVRSGELTDK